MSTINFLTPISFENVSENVFYKFFNGVESYFSIKGEKRYVTSFEKVDGRYPVELREESSEIWLTALKVMSYVTLIATSQKVEVNLNF